MGYDFKIGIKLKVSSLLHKSDLVLFFTSDFLY